MTTLPVDLQAQLDQGLARVEAMQAIRHNVVAAHSLSAWRQHFPPAQPAKAEATLAPLAGLLPEASLASAARLLTQHDKDHRRQALRTIKQGQKPFWREAHKAYAAARATGMTHAEIVGAFQQFIADRFREQAASLEAKLPKKPSARALLQARAVLGDPGAVKRIQKLYGDELKGPKGTKNPFTQVIDTIRTVRFTDIARIRFEREERRAARAAKKAAKIPAS